MIVNRALITGNTGKGGSYLPDFCLNPDKKYMFD
jgi:GDP-D-mannose dehydratase